MNSIVFFGFLVADISAIIIPGTISNTVDLTDERFVSNSIAKSIEALTQSIKDAGLDPLYINNRRVVKSLPVAALFNYEAFVEDFLSTGLSHIVIHKIKYSLITSRLNFDIELPLIDVSVGAASIQAMLFSSSLDVKASGKFEIRNVRITGQVRVNFGVFSGISIRRVIINFTIGDIFSDIKLVIQGKDYSTKVNNFIGSTVPDTIKAHNAEVNELLEIVLMDFITANLP